MQESQKQNQRIKQDQKQIEEQKNVNVLLKQCFEIISQQKEHIRRIEKENLRKEKYIDKIMKNSKRRNGQDEQQREKEEQDKHFQKVIELLAEERELNNMLSKKNSQYQYQKIKTGQQLFFLQKRLNQLQQINSKLSSQVSQLLHTISELKNTYQIRIDKILGQFKKKIYEDISKSKKKNMLQSQNRNNDLFNQKITINYQRQKQTEISYNFFTPNKVYFKNLSGTKDTNEKYLKTNDTEITRKLQNTPYRNNFSNHLLRQQVLEENQFQSKSNGKKNQKMLQDIDDVQYLTESQQSFYTNESQSPKQSLIQSNKNKISINQFIMKHKRELDKKGSFDALEKKTQGKNPKIQQILQDLSMKIKKFQARSL